MRCRAAQLPSSFSGLDHRFGHPNEYSEWGKERIKHLKAKNTFISRYPSADERVLPYLQERLQDKTPCVLGNMVAAALAWRAASGNRGALVAIKAFLAQTSEVRYAHKLVR